MYAHSTASMINKLNISKPQMIAQALSHELCAWLSHARSKFTRVYLISQNVNTQFGRRVYEVHTIRL